MLRETWPRMWPPLLAVVTVTAVGVPAAVASYRHARTVVERSGDPVMAPWLPLSVDGMLLAALVVIWVRRRRGERAGVFPWVSFTLGMAATIAANLAAASPTPEGVVVALWPPVALALTLELVALVAYREPGARRVADLVATLPAPPTPTLATTATARPRQALADRASSPGDLGDSAGGGEIGIPGDLLEPDDATPDWLDDIVLQRAARYVAAGRAKGESYGRGRLARDLDITTHRARLVIEELDRRDLAKVGA